MTQKDLLGKYDDNLAKSYKKGYEAGQADAYSSEQMEYKQPIAEELTLHVGPTDEEIRMTALHEANVTRSSYLDAIDVVSAAKLYETYIRTGK